MSRLEALLSQGQSIWLDYLDRELIQSGDLAALVESGVRGVTTNPSIFHQAITGSALYDESIRELLHADPHIDAAGLCHWLTVEDVQMAAEVLRPLWDASHGDDGYVSIEVAPHLAWDTPATIDAAHRLWCDVGHPNVMIKVPGTLPGLPAIERLVAEGINVNVTLLFSVLRYEQVIDAYLRGLDKNTAPAEVASVASFFISRVDTQVDGALSAVGTAEAKALQGRIAIANARLAYALYQEYFQGEAFAEYRKRGARVQRPLWGSTGTKNPKYPDTLYVDQLIGPDTVNTLPMKTLDAFQSHGEVRFTLADDVRRARREVAALADMDIDLGRITDDLERAGVAAFQKSWDDLLAAVDERRIRVAREFAGPRPGE